MNFKLVECPKCNKEHIVNFMTVGTPCGCGTYLYSDEPENRKEVEKEVKVVKVKKSKPKPRVIKKKSSKPKVVKSLPKPTVKTHEKEYNELSKRLDELESKLNLVTLDSKTINNIQTDLIDMRESMVKISTVNAITMEDLYLYICGKYGINKSLKPSKLREEKNLPDGISGVSKNAIMAFFRHTSYHEVFIRWVYEAMTEVK